MVGYFSRQNTNFCYMADDINLLQELGRGLVPSESTPR